MTLQRGEVVIVRFPFASGTGAKVRPALVFSASIDLGLAHATQVLLQELTPKAHFSRGICCSRLRACPDTSPKRLGQPREEI
jgi:hypothetical protein